MRKLSKISLAILSATSINYASFAYAEEAAVEEDVEVIQVTGIRSSLTAALATKREANNLVEVVEAVDIGKLPDQNLAEVLENVTGIQITREAGVGTGVQIRGTDSNRIQINGVSTVGAGNDRTGMSFEDIDASIISGLEIIKSPEAKTTEGSVGGTINLKTIRPLSLSEPLASIRVQAEKSSLSTDSATPRLSGTYGDTWLTDAGEFGLVISGSYTESDNSAFRPRLDRDNLTTCSNSDPLIGTTCPAGASHFLGVQFLNQVQVNQEYETTNLAGSFEYAPNDDVKFYFDVVLNEQTRRQESSRVQFSNISQLNGQSDGDDYLWANFTDFETYDLGSLAGEGGAQDLGSILAVTGGTFSPQQDDGTGGRGAPFMRVSMDSGARETDTHIFRLGSEFTVNDDLSGSVEVSTTESKTVNPNLSLTLNFINPNSDRFGTRDENGTPVSFDLSDGIAFGINFDDPYAPTPEQLLDPANYVMDSGGTFSANERENKEDTFRTDFTYYVDDIEAITSIDFGYRYNKRTSLRDNISASAGGTSNFDNSLNGSFVADLLTEIPDNFGAGTGKDLFVNGVLQFDPEAAVDAEAFVAAVNAGITASGVSQSPISTALASSQSAYFDIEEVSNALYAQVNFEYGIFRGNAGLRYVKTDFDSVSFENDYVDASTTNLVQVNGSSSNSFVLPRISIVADLHEDVLLRASYSEDINRPDFEHMTAARTMPNRGGVNDVSRVGNADLEPEEIESFDISLEWYFAPASLVSVGYFEKTRSNLFGQTIEQPGVVGDGLREQQDIFNRDGPDVGGSDDGAPCLLGGVFSEDTDAGIFRNTDLADRGSDNGRGVCVGNATRFNASGETKQSGFEFSFQYSLAEFEEDLGWASGFGVIANYTIQDADVNTGFIDIGETRAQAIYEAQGFDRVTNPVSREAASLLNLSEDAYNFTVFYEKYGLTARARYTYRSAYQTDNLPGTSNEFDPMGTRAVVEARGQLNASVSYNVNENLVLSVDAVNLTESDQDISCISEGSILCYKGITDRRVIAGVSYKF